MFAKRLLSLLFALVIFGCSPLICHATSDVWLTQAYVQEQTIDIFVMGEMDSDSLGCKVSNQTAEIIESGLLADKGATVRTTILIDVSTSMPENTREMIKDYLKSLIENLGDNEQYKIVSFGEQISVLHDFSSDRYDLANAVNEIEFNGQQSKIYDAIYNTIPEALPIDGDPCYYRTIIITDGVDDTASGITKEELYLKLQTESYPIHVLAVSAIKQIGQNKDLAALTRISGGVYYGLDPETEMGNLREAFPVDNIFWIRAKIPVELLDGSTRQVNISDSEASLQFDIKVPVFDVAATETVASSEPSSQFTDTNSQEFVSAVTAPDESVDAGGNFFRDNGILLYTGVGACIFAVIVILLLHLRKTREMPDFKAEKTKVSRKISAETELISMRNSNSDEKVPCIRLRNAGAPDQVWEISLVREIFIGRETSCQVCLTESSVARQQCKLYINEIATIENLSRSNVTQLNGKQVNVPSEIKTGDKIKCGRITLIVDALYGSIAQNAENLNKGTVYINV